jgi:hypothetical protein
VDNSSIFSHGIKPPKPAKIHRDRKPWTLHRPMVGCQAGPRAIDLSHKARAKSVIGRVCDLWLSGISIKHLPWSLYIYIYIHISQAYIFYIFSFTGDSLKKLKLKKQKWHDGDVPFVVRYSIIRHDSEQIWSIFLVGLASRLSPEGRDDKLLGSWVVLDWVIHG